MWGIIWMTMLNKWLSQCNTTCVDDVTILRGMHNAYNWVRSILKHEFVITWQKKYNAKTALVWKMILIIIYRRICPFSKIHISKEVDSNNFIRKNILPVKFLFSLYGICCSVRASLYFFAKPKSIMYTKFPFLPRPIRKLSGFISLKRKEKYAINI